MKYKKIITGADGRSYEISSDIDCLDNISVADGYIGTLSVQAGYSIGSITIKEVNGERKSKNKETSFEHILRKEREKGRIHR